MLSPFTSRITMRAATPRKTTVASTFLRQFTSSPLGLYPRKDSQHKDSINTEGSEYSKSGTDDQAARQEDAAFDPHNTDPAREKEVAGMGNGGGTESEGNPLEVSPANPEVSKQSGEQEGGAENGAERTERSGGGSGPKAAKNQ